MQPALRNLMVGLLVTLAACEGEVVDRVFPRVEVEPETVDFGIGIVNEATLATLTLRNLGPGSLEFREVRIESGSEVFQIDGSMNGSETQSIAPFSKGGLQLLFTPLEAGSRYEGILAFITNDPNREQVTVSLRGEGGVREIEVNPQQIDFGVVNEGTAPRRGIEILNVGGDQLRVDWTWTSTSRDLQLASMPQILDLAPDTSTVVEIVYAPQDLGRDTGILVINSNDDDEPLIEIPVTGRANLAPRAIAWLCSTDVGVLGCEGRTLRKTMTVSASNLAGFDGTDTYDPEGGEATSFTWRLVDPPPDRDPPFIFPDTATENTTGQLEVRDTGRYVLRLSVIDEQGLESLDTPESRVEIRPRDLEVYLRWDVATDVDLHVVSPGGTLGDYGTGQAGSSTGTDCSSFNRRPNWGDLSDDADDPSLDRDVVNGLGPEVFSLDHPIDGEPYRVFAHYCDSRNEGVEANAWIQVFAQGELATQVPATVDSRRLLLPGQLWTVAELVWNEETQSIAVSASDAPILLRPDLCTID